MKKISSDILRRFLNDEIIEMKKYIKGKEKEAQKDLGQGPAFEWIEQRSKSFREEWFKKHEEGG